MLSDPLESNPGKHNHAEIISIGDELLIGQVVNTNASWLAEQLFLSGFMVKRIVAIPDEEQAIFKALDDAVVQAGVVVITGGLGPTADDITKPALCRYFGTDLVFSQLAFEQISELFVRRGWAMNDRNRMQAMLPEACMPLKNSSGTAPGMWFVKDKSIVVSLPGVPFEMQDIFTNELAPRLKQLHTGEVLLYKTILTTGVGESVIADRLSAWESLLPQSFKLAYLPQPGLVRLRLTANGSDAPQLEAELERLKLELVSLLSDIVFGYDGDTVEGVVGQKLAALSKTLSTAESCTGGTIAAMITSVPGSSAYFKGSVVAYANETKGKLLGVDEVLIRKYGAVSREVVEVMASQARALMHTDYAIATSGIAGPDGATPGKPVGTVWIALAGPKGIVTEHYLFGEHRGRNIRRASLAALNLLRKSLDTELISDSES
jgi:nicotinamide-nucleotide amidase